MDIQFLLLPVEHHLVRLGGPKYDNCASEIQNLTFNFIEEHERENFLNELSQILQTTTSINTLRYPSIFEEPQYQQLISQYIRPEDTGNFLISLRELFVK